MDPIEEFARLKDDIRRLEDRVAVLRDGFLKPGARLRSNQHEVIIKVTVRSDRPAAYRE